MENSLKLIKVKVFPKSKKENVAKKAEDSFEVMVRAKAERGEANRETIKVLASYFNLPENCLRIIKGSKKRSKIFEIVKDEKK